MVPMKWQVVLLPFTATTPLPSPHNRWHQASVSVQKQPAGFQHRSTDLQQNSSNVPNHGGHFCTQHCSASLLQSMIGLTRNKHQSGQTMEQHNKGKYPFATFTKIRFLLVFYIRFYHMYPGWWEPPGSLQYLQILHFFYGLNGMFSAIALWFLMFCFRHFSLYEPGQRARHRTHCSSWTQSAAKITFYFHSYHFSRKMPIKTVKINLQPLRSEPKLLALFTQFNVLLQWALSKVKP